MHRGISALTTPSLSRQRLAGYAAHPGIGPAAVQNADLQRRPVTVAGRTLGAGVGLLPSAG